MKYGPIMLAAFALTACGSETPRPATPASIPVDKPSTALPTRPVIEKRGLEGVIGKDAGTLRRMFGEPRLDVIEPFGRKLQFAGKACILDAYLYPDGKGGTEIVTYVDARRSDGAEVDRAACVNALQQR